MERREILARLRKNPWAAILLGGRWSPLLPQDVTDAVREVLSSSYGTYTTKIGGNCIECGAALQDAHVGGETRCIRVNPKWPVECAYCSRFRPGTLVAQEVVDAWRGESTGHYTSDDYPGFLGGPGVWIPSTHLF